MFIIVKLYYFFYKLFRYYLLKLYKAKGLKIGSNFTWHTSDHLDTGFAWLINIGDNVVLSEKVFILAHDASTSFHLKYRRIGKVSIGDRVFVGAGTVILPGVTIGDDVIIGAGSVVTGDIPSSSVAVGNPARIISTLDEFLEKRRNEMKIYPTFNKGYTTGSNISGSQKHEMCIKIKDKFGYVE